MDLGVKRPRVACMMRNSHRVLELHYAMAFLRGILVNFNVHSTAHELRGLLATAEPDVVFIDNDLTSPEVRFLSSSPEVRSLSSP